MGHRKVWCSWVGQVIVAHERSWGGGRAKGERGNRSWGGGVKAGEDLGGGKVGKDLEEKGEDLGGEKALGGGRGKGSQWTYGKKKCRPCCICCEFP